MKRLLNPLSYVLLCILYSSLALALKNPWQLKYLWILAILVDYRDGFSAIWHRFVGQKRLAWLLVSIFVIQLLFRHQGEVLYQQGCFRVYAEGWHFAILLSLRILTIYLCASSLGRLDFSLYRTAFSHLHFPEELTFMISYMAQLLPSLQKGFRAQMQELSTRGIRMKHLSIKKRLEIYQILAIASVAGIISGSTKQAIALELRGFRSRGKRSTLHLIPFSGWDIVALAWAAVVVLFLLLGDVLFSEVLGLS